MNFLEKPFELRTITHKKDSLRFKFLIHRWLLLLHFKLQNERTNSIYTGADSSLSSGSCRQSQNFNHCYGRSWSKTMVSEGTQFFEEKPINPQMPLTCQIREAAKRAICKALFLTEHTGRGGAQWRGADGTEEHNEYSKCQGPTVNETLSKKTRKQSKLTTAKWD